MFSVQGLKRQIASAFGLMVVIPSLVFVFLVDKQPETLTVPLIVFTIMGTTIGFSLVWDIVRKTLHLSQSAYSLARGYFSPSLQEEKTDEIGLLGESITTIAKRIEENTRELQNTASLLAKTKRELTDTVLYAHNIIQSMSDLLLVVDHEGKITTVNNAARDLLRYTEKELLGRPVHVLFDKEGMTSSLLTGGPSSSAHQDIIGDIKAALRTKHGEIIPVSMTASLLKDSEGQRKGTVIIFRDTRETLHLIDELTAAKASLEMKVMERTKDIEKVRLQVEKAYREIKEKDAMIYQQEKMASIGQLAAGVAHEINNPICFVSSNLEILKDHFVDIASYLATLRRGADLMKNRDGDQAVHTYLEDLGRLQATLDIDGTLADLQTMVKESREGIERIKAIIKDLRTFSHVDEDTTDYFDVNQGLDSTLHMVWNEIKYKARVVKNYGNLPTILCYPQQLNQVFLNLLINSAQAIQGNGVITLTTHRDGRSIQIEVSDTGVGIPEANLHRIFDPFFTTKKPGEGTGLGLSIAYGIVKKHRGDIAVRSAVGKGTTFTVTLPVEGVVAHKRGDGDG